MYSRNGYPMIYHALRERPKLILSGHLDVVVDDARHYSPPRIAGRRLYGTGSLDMKTAVAAFINLMNNYDRQRPPVGLLLTSDEEIGGLHGAGYAVREGLLDLSGCQLVIAGEPTDLDIVNQERGIYWLEATKKGRSSHGGLPGLGDNALVSMASCLDQMMQRYNRNNDTGDFTTSLNVGCLYGGSRINRVPDIATAQLDFRYTSPGEKREFEEELGGYGIEIAAVMLDLPPTETDAGIHAVEMLASAAKDATGKCPATKPARYFSDGKHFRIAGKDAVCFGPAGKGAHTIEEWVSTSSVQRYVAALDNLFRALL